LSTGVPPCILNIGTKWRYIISACPGCFTPRERAADNHWIGGWVGPRDSLDAEAKRKILDPARN